MPSSDAHGRQGGPATATGVATGAQAHAPAASAWQPRAQGSLEDMYCGAVIPPQLSQDLSSSAGAGMCAQACADVPATWQDFGTSLLVRLAEASLRAPAHCFDPVKDFMPGIGQELGPWPGLQSQRQL